MLRRAVEVAAITGSVAAAAGIAASLGFGTSRAIPGLAGAAIVAGSIFFRSGRSPLTSIFAALLSGIGAFAVDWFVLFVLGAGYPALREVRQSPIYQVLLVVIFGAIAALDSSSASADRPARP